MEIDILGKVREKKLSYSHAMLPVFEAVVNSIHAIEDRKLNQPGTIELQLVRSGQQEIDTTALPAITDFILTDNGIGFTAANFESFNYAHSSYKLERGGKGIGRFTWLRAFTRAEIDSVFEEGGIIKHRVFNFERTKQGLEKHTLADGKPDATRKTTVVLKTLDDDYQKWCNSKPEDIALKIIEHCFIYFLDEKCPRIIIKDTLNNSEIVVNDYFSLYTKNAVTNKLLVLEEYGQKHVFRIDLVKLYSPKSDNKIHYCAHTREVLSDKISDQIPDLSTFLEDENGEKFSIAAYVSSNFLDSKVNEERTDITFGKASELFTSEITQDSLRDSIILLIEEEFKSYLTSISEAKIQRIRTFVQNHPRYRHLLKYRAGEIRKLSATLSDEKLEIELFKIHQKLELEVKSEVKTLMNNFNKITDIAQFKSKFSETYNKIIEVGNSALSEYVIHRKLVLELLEKHLKKSSEGKYSKEDIVHSLIFPLKQLSDDIGFEEHNLWVIDERLAYHKYLASDKQFNQIEEVDSKSKDRPDILIFNRPLALSIDNKPYSSMVIIEFKRPMRDDYTDEENPINQVTTYARELRDANSKDKDGRLLDLRTGVPIYAYIVCDLTAKLRIFAENQAFTKLPDNDGYFNFNKNLDLYIEIISFDKLVRDAGQRNKALFDKLNIPL
ncbi:MAG: hypothetical protein JWO58_2964 [Chitinophagaceae bacterium]|nr:hypothetical protein [Chitinophagaceae bacterium]